MARELVPCGTNAAFERHRRHGEEPCQPCREAGIAYHRPYGRAHGAALTKRLREAREREEAASIEFALVPRHRAVLAAHKRGELILG